MAISRSGVNRSNKVRGVAETTRRCDYAFQTDPKHVGYDEVDVAEDYI